MFLSESIVRAIHADRIRDIERATRERRLIDGAEDAGAAGSTSIDVAVRQVPPPTPARRGRTGVPA